MKKGLAILFGIILLASCSSDNPVPEPSFSIIGDWYMYKQITTPEYGNWVPKVENFCGTNVESFDCEIYLSFYSDGTNVWHFNTPQTAKYSYKDGVITFDGSPVPIVIDDYKKFHYVGKLIINGTTYIATNYFKKK